jgi:hypothetical protein
VLDRAGVPADDVGTVITGNMTQSSVVHHAGDLSGVRAAQAAVGWGRGSGGRGAMKRGLNPCGRNGWRAYNSRWPGGGRPRRRQRSATTPVMIQRVV